MKRLLSSRRAKLAVTVLAIGALSGCASVSLEQNVSRVNTIRNVSNALNSQPNCWPSPLGRKKRCNSR
jgi:hypothetical protein